MLEFIHNSINCESVVDFLALIDEMKTLVSFTHIRSVFGDRREYSARKMDGFQMLTRFPAEWEARYNEKDYFLYDKIAQTAFYTGGLHHWSDCTQRQYADEASNRKSGKIMHEATEFGLHEGWLYSMQCRRSTEWSVISCAARKCGRDTRSRSILKHLAPYLCLALQRAAVKNSKVKARLSPKEYEVLSWTAHGKTAWETSAIMKISRRTVEFHMGNILKKLDAINSQQAIAIAVSTGLITY